MTTQPTIKQDGAIQPAADGLPAEQKTFLGRLSEAHQEALAARKEAFKDYGAILQAQRTAGVDVWAALSHGVPKLKKPENLADLTHNITQAHPIVVASNMLPAAFMACVAALKTDFTEGTEVRGVVNSATGALNSTCDTATCALDGDVSGTLSNAPDCARSIAAASNTARTYGNHCIKVGTAVAAAGAIVGAPVTTTVAGAAVVGAIAIDGKPIAKNTWNILTDEDKRNYALYGDSVTSKGRELAREAMKNDLNHAGDPLEGQPKYTDVLDVEVPEEMKIAAGNAAIDFILEKSGLNKAHDIAVSLPKQQVESNGFERFLEQAASTLEQMRAAGETRYREEPGSLSTGIAARQTERIELGAPEPEAVVESSAYTPSF